LVWSPAQQCFAAKSRTAVACRTRRCCLFRRPCAGASVLSSPAQEAFGKAVPCHIMPCCRHMSGNRGGRRLSLCPDCACAPAGVWRVHAEHDCAGQP
jgi:hypothetical protein